VPDLYPITGTSPRRHAAPGDLADALGVWVPEMPHTSCGLLILVERSTEPVAPLDGVRLARRWSWGSGLAERAVWPTAVVVVLIPAGHRGGVPLIDQDAVEEFAANGADETFGDRVGRGARTGVLIVRTSMAVKSALNAVVNLASRSRIMNRKRRRTRRGPLRGFAPAGGPSARRVDGDSEDVHLVGWRAR
jgi:hypothetical protein